MVFFTPPAVTVTLGILLYALRLCLQQQQQTQGGSAMQLC